MNHSGQLDALAHWARERPDAPAIRFMEDGESVTQHLGYGALFERVENTARSLLAEVAPGERVGLCLASEFEQLVHVLACFRAGLVAVPSLSASNERAIRRIEGHLGDSGAAVVLVDGLFEARLGLRPSQGLLGRLRRLRADQLPAVAEPASPASDPWPDAQQLAYLQYTSGSTMMPRGVMLTHGNLAAQQEMLRRRLQVMPGETIVNWMPLHHDFGLVMSLQALYAGACCVLIPPLRVVEQPARWLRAISRFNAQISASATSMLSICVQKVKPASLAGVDLAGLSHLVVGAEPIHAGAIDAFCRRFESTGLNPQSILPAYGMAEATLCITTTLPGGPVRRRFDAAELTVGRAVECTDGRELVSSGTACFPSSIHVVDPSSLRGCSDGVVGELWVRTPSVGAGYWQQPELTASQFQASLPDREVSGLLRTGDLAFIHEGNVYITGRSKDLIIINGANHWPQDIEWTVAQAHPDLEAGACAAIGVEHDGTERLVVVAEVRRTARRGLDVDEAAARIRAAVVKDHEVDLHALVLLTPAGMPRTSSGKLQRQRCRQLYEANSLPVYGVWRRPSPAAQVADAQVSRPTDIVAGELLVLCREILQSPGLQLDDNVMAHGADSLKMAEMLAEIESRWGRSIDLMLFSADPTPRALLVQLEGPPPPANPQPAADAHAGSELWPSLAPEHEHALSTYTAAWQAQWTSSRRLVFGLNLAGRKPPLFWCFQGHLEFTQMARHLGEDQPLYGMRSGHLVFDHTDTSAVTALALRYAEEIHRHVPRDAYLLGGNCQAGVVMSKVARLLIAAGRKVDALFLLENIVPRVDPSPMPCPVALFYGERSTHFNPLLQFHSPQGSWEKLYPLGWSMDIVWGGHGQYFDDPNVIDFCAKLERRLSLAACAAPRRALPARALSASIHADAPVDARPNEVLSLEVTVVNLSDQRWPAGGASGLVVANHWLDAQEAPVAWLDGYSLLAGEVMSGDAVQVSMVVRAPGTEGEFILELDLAEQGVAWMSQRGGKTWRQRIQVRGT